MRAVVLTFVFVVAILALSNFANSAETPRKLWATSKIVGSPEPLLPLITEPIWKGLPTKKPLEMKWLPGSASKLVYADHRETKDSISKLWVFEDKPAVTSQVEVLSLTNRLVYGFCFHPDFKKNGFVFLHTNGPRRGPGASPAASKKRLRFSSTRTGSSPLAAPRLRES